MGLFHSSRNQITKCHGIVQVLRHRKASENVKDFAFATVLATLPHASSAHTIAVVHGLFVRTFNLGPQCNANAAKHLKNSLVIVTAYMRLRPKNTATRTLNMPSKAGSFGRIAWLSIKTTRLTKNQSRDSRK